MTKEELHQMIAAGNTQSALDTLFALTHADFPGLHEQAILQSNRLREINRQQSMGLVDFGHIGPEKARINKALLDLISELPDSPAATTAQSKSQSNDSRGSNKTDVWKKVGYAGLILGILASVIKIIEFYRHPSGQGEETMQLTVYVQDIENKPTAELPNNGKIIVDFGNDRRAPIIGENGRTNLGEIPEKFRGEKITIALQAQGYEPADRAKQYILDGKPIYFLVQRDNSSGTIQGIIKDRSGEKFIAGALVMIDQDTTLLSDTLGRFKMVLPPNKQHHTYTLTVKKDGYKVRNDYYRSQSGPIEIRLDK